MCLSFFTESNIDTREKTDEVEMEDEEEETDVRHELEASGKVTHGAKQAVTCRNVTLNTLMDDGVIQPGKGVLSIDYLVRCDLDFSFECQ